MTNAQSIYSINTLSVGLSVIASLVMDVLVNVLNSSFSLFSYVNLASSKDDYDR